jgi:Sulfotransferase domain
MTPGRPRCWGVGLSRTGNTSLCAALDILGYDPVLQDPTFEQLRTLEGGCGNNVVLHFKYLDYIFPGSKFVLTTRSVDGWLASSERSHRLNPRPVAGEHERIARRMAIYECVGYDEPTLTAAFHRHHADVRRYFRHRPSDLLELDATAGDGWNLLCPFVGEAEPSVNYPDMNKGVAASAPWTRGAAY